MAQKLDPKAAGYSIAILGALCMLVLGILGKLGIYTNAVNAMKQWHIFFDLTFVGIIAGIIEGAVAGFVIAYLAVYFYNKFV